MNLSRFLALTVLGSTFFYGSAALALTPDWQVQGDNGRRALYTSQSRCQSNYNASCSSEQWCNITRWSLPRTREMMVKSYNKGHTVVIYETDSSSINCTEKK